MWDRIRGGRSQSKRHSEGTIKQQGRRPSHQPFVETLEDRQLLASASLQPIASLVVPAQQGQVVPLLAKTAATDPQTYTVTSNNPDVAATVVEGPFWNVGVSYTDPKTPANSFTGTLTFQLFQNFTPNTVSMITEFTNDNYYVSTGKFFPRIVKPPLFPNTVLQGGSNSETQGGPSGQPGTPFANETLQQLIFGGSDQLAMANGGGFDSNDTQFFITTGPVPSLDYTASPGAGAFTIFGQLVTGQSTLAKMAAIPVMPNTVSGEDSQPMNPLTITSTTLTSTNPNGALVLDTTQAKEGETATITVTATDTKNGTKTTQSFAVTVGAYSGPAPPVSEPNINFRPFANSAVTNVTTSTATQVQLNGQSGFPDTTMPGTLTYSLVSQPAHGTVTNFDASTGALTYTPDKGFTGTDSLQYEVTATGPLTTPNPSTVSNPGTVTFLVGAQNTQTASMVGNNLVVQPVPSREHPTNTIVVKQVRNAASPSNFSLVVTANGVVDQTVFPTSVNQIIVFGGRKANNQVVIDPSVTVPSTISSGQGILNRLEAGSSQAREHGWYGHTTLIGGSGPNQLIGLAGHVRFKPTKTTTLIYTAEPKRRTNQLNPVPPVQTFYKFRDGQLIAIPATVFKAPPFKRHKLEE